MTVLIALFVRFVRFVPVVVGMNSCISGQELPHRILHTHAVSSLFVLLTRKPCCYCVAVFITIKLTITEPALENGGGACMCVPGAAEAGVKQ